MVRRISVMLVAAVVAGLALLATPASAQEGSPPSVAGIEIERGPEVKGVSTARTGSETMPLVLIAGGLLVVGTVLVVGARRRQAAASPAAG